jgi:predicted amidohydrolase
VKISLLQFAPVWENRVATRRKIAGLVAQAKIGEWLILPEMALTGFSMNVTQTEWDVEDNTFFERLASDRNCTITVGGVENGANTAFVFRPNEAGRAVYRKRHLFSFAGEDRSYSAGDTTGTYEIGGMRVGQGICYDLRFPYVFWNEAPSVEAYCVIAAWGDKRSEHWKSLLRARAIENQAFIIGVNRIGSEPTVGYTGDSSIIDPLGSTVLDCGSAEGVFGAEVDVSAVARWRESFPAIKDRHE